MVRLKLDPDALGLSAVMERVSRCRVKDCFKDSEVVYFIVGNGEMGRALGKGGSNIKRVQDVIGKRIKVIEYNDDVCKFVRNVIYPVKVQDVSLNGNILKIRDDSKKTKSLLIGRQSKNLQALKRAVTRFFNVEIIIE